MAVRHGPADEVPGFEPGAAAGEAGEEPCPTGSKRGQPPPLLPTSPPAEELADRARQSLATLGLYPTVVAGDGEAGYPARGPYTRIISTAAVRQVPQAWLDQAAPDAVLVTPLYGPFGHDALLRLVADGHGGGEAALSPASPS
ncbi:Protein-L-isoaspartate O-methyltransferase [Streptomyces hundungensis]|uniref:Protein-L-isoaspartate O-methyltransferase n=2 Tax=Streptomyces hundungensis TaxID=1077946 RepID=A0A387H745_9ACTN|nr:hypothetical protein [Streptomyces hundungensis]AYG78411.1 Protein-L-isoaspartate O-methyltransferase [Streptomyces hundungensis]